MHRIPFANISEKSDVRQVSPRDKSHKYKLRAKPIKIVFAFARCSTDLTSSINQAEKRKETEIKAKRESAILLNLPAYVPRLNQVPIAGFFPSLNIFIPDKKSLRSSRRSELMITQHTDLKLKARSLHRVIKGVKRKVNLSQTQKSQNERAEKATAGYDVERKQK